jgi:hypothetical protein
MAEPECGRNVSKATDRSVAIHILFNLAYVAEFQYKMGYATTKNGRYGNPQHTFFTKKLSSLRIFSATNHFGHSLYLISMDEKTECRSLYFSMDY